MTDNWKGLCCTHAGKGAYKNEGMPHDIWIYSLGRQKIMKVGQHYYSTLYKGQEPLELLMVFNPDPSQLSLKNLKELPFQNLSQDFSKDMYHLEKCHQFLSKLEICRPQENT